MSVVSACVFCTLPSERVEYETSRWIVFVPIGPVNSAHRLIVPKRHIPDFEPLRARELGELPGIVGRLKATLASDYNLGVNAGSSAGQTVFHLHLHFIGRETGDVPDPAGGIIAPLGALFENSRFGDYLKGLRTQ